MRVEKYQTSSRSRHEPSSPVPINISTDICVAFMDEIHVCPDIGVVYPDTGVSPGRIAGEFKVELNR